MVVNIVFYKVVEIIILKQKILSTPKYTIQQLLDYKYYDENIPICLFLISIYLLVKLIMII